MQVEAIVEIVIQGSSEVVDREVAQTHIVAIAVIDEISTRVDLVPLKAVQEVFAQESRIDWRKRFCSVFSELLDELVCNLRLVSQDSILKQSGIELSGLLHFVCVHHVQYVLKMAQISDRLAKRLAEEGMVAVNFEFLLVDGRVSTRWIKLCFTLKKPVGLLLQKLPFGLCRRQLFKFGKVVRFLTRQHLTLNLFYVFLRDQSLE